MIRLQTLRVRGVRGIVDGPDLNIEKGGVILCGDNATGKSSYIDAIEKVLTNRCSSLDDGGRGTSWSKQGSHINCADSEIDLTIFDGNKDVSINLNTDISTLEKQTQGFLEAARQQSFVLRRRTLLDFINAAPRQRYLAIEYFLNLEEYGAFENQLKEMLKDVDTQLSIAESDKTQNERTLKEKLKLKYNEGISDKRCLDTVNLTLNVAGIELLETLENVSNRVQKVEALLVPFKDIGILQKVQALADYVKQIPDIQNLRQTANQYLLACEEIIAEESRLKGHFYVQVLETGFTWITEDGLERCPLCDNPINIADVKAHVDARIAKHEQFIELKKQQAEAHKAFLNALEQHKHENIERQWREAFDSEVPEQFKTTINHVASLLKLHRAPISTGEIRRSIQDFPEEYYLQGIQILRDEINLKLASFPDSTRYAQLYQAKSQLVATSFHLQQIANVTDLINHLKICQGHIKILVDIAEKGRKNAVQKLLDTVVEVANGYFQQIHPKEGIGSPKLEVPKRGSGSIELISQFHTEIGDPRGHYSEGHIDSLGLCLFLAIRRIHYTQRPELSLLVLDDVMHSVDANHRRDTANLIFREFSDHQIIITTHDPLWFEYLKSASQKSKHKFTQHRIAHWTLEHGPVWGDHLANYEWLISDNGITAKPSDLVIKAGILLEEMLQNLCNNLGISVPFRIRGDYTIGPLWDSFFVAVKKNEEFYDNTKLCLEKIEELKNLRNWVGAHWNEWAQTLTQNEALAFTGAVLQLQNHTYCNECSQFIVRISELDGVWACAQECKRYNKKQKKATAQGSKQTLGWQELAAMGIPAGQQISRLISMLQDEQKAGRITTRVQAEEFVRKQQALRNKTS